MQFCTPLLFMQITNSVIEVVKTELGRVFFFLHIKSNVQWHSNNDWLAPYVTTSAYIRIMSLMPSRKIKKIVAVEGCTLMKILKKSRYIAYTLRTLLTFVLINLNVKWHPRLIFVRYEMFSLLNLLPNNISK